MSNFRARNSYPSILLFMMLFAIPSTSISDVVRFEGSPDALPHDQYINVVSEIDSPVQQAYIKSKDGVYVATAIRKPPGEGPFPALVMFHGAPGGRGMEQLVGWSKGDHGGPVWERFLQEGYVVVVADYRGGDRSTMNTLNIPSDDRMATAIDDGMAIVEFVSSLPYVDSTRTSVYGVSLGGNLALYLAAKMPVLQSVVVGAPFPLWFLGANMPPEGFQIDFSTLEFDSVAQAANIETISMPVYILVGTADPLMPLSTVLHDELENHGKKVKLEIYEHGYHDFVLGPQGHDRRDLPDGEILLQGALDALERTVEFVANPN